MAKKKSTKTETIKPVKQKVKEPAKGSKLALMVALLSRPEGTTLEDVIAATGWQVHTVRSALSHALGKKRGYQIVSDKPKGEQRIYKIAQGA